MTANSGQFTAGEVRKSQLLWGNRRNLQKRESWGRFHLQIA